MRDFEIASLGAISTMIGWVYRILRIISPQFDGFLPLRDAA